MGGTPLFRFRCLAVKDEKKSAGLVLEDMDNYRLRGNWGFLDDNQIRFMRRLKTFRVDLDWDRLFEDGRRLADRTTGPSATRKQPGERIDVLLLLMVIEHQGMDNNMVETLKRKLEEERQREEEEEQQQKAKKAQDRENEEPVKKKIMVEQV